MFFRTKRIFVIALAGNHPH